MRRLIIVISALLCGATLAQNPESSGLGSDPVEITSSGGTSYQNGVAVARDNVAIRVRDTDIYADAAEYDSTTKVIRLEGNVRIYRGAELYVGDRATYNTETKEVNADKLRTSERPFLLGGERISTIEQDARLVEKASFTTHDSAKPDYQIRATTVRIYEKDRIVMQNAMFYVGRVPIFYWPYFYQSLDEDAFSFVVSPAYMTSWGPSLLGRASFPITKDISGIVRLDYRVRRGGAIGFQPDIRFPKNAGYASIRSYFVDDQNPTLNRTSLPRGSIPTRRYRVALESRFRFTDDITGFIRGTKMSDPFLHQDFFQVEFTLDPEPDNLLVVNKYNPRYSLTAYTRYQLNKFYEATERLPEIALDITRQPIGSSGIFYEGEATMSNLRRNFPRRSYFQDYEALRLDTFHQFLYPKTYLGWLSVVPRIGFRATYYSETRDLDGLVFPASANDLIPHFLIPPPNQDQPLRPGGDRWRTLMNAGAEASFKVSRTWEQAQNRTLGLDGLRHIIQPFANFSYVTGNGTNPAEILQFDRYIPSTRLRPIDFPQFTSIDSIDDWTIARVGIRNRLQTRRDDATINWMELETYFDANIDNPYDRSNFSNVYNGFRFSPVPWMTFGVGSQIPLLGEGFTEVNTDVRVQPTAGLDIGFAHRFLNENPFFPNSSLYLLGVYYRINDHWSAGASGRYEASTGVLEEQRYTVYRDLTSWVASLGTVVRNNGGVREYGVLLTFTLKAVPNLSFDLSYDPGAPAGQPHGQAGLLPLP